MIIDLLLLVIQGVLNIILSPLQAINFAIDFVGNIPIIAEFLGIVAYILPWNNFLPLFAVLFSIFIFRIAVSLIKTVWDIIPFV